VNDDAQNLTERERAWRHWCTCVAAGKVLFLDHRAT
jgi:hypothetical protein